MDTILYSEFGILSKILEYHRIGNKLKGMRESKPFKSGTDILINIGKDLCKVDNIQFYNKQGQEINRDKVFLDTNIRIAGIIHNKTHILLLKKLGENEFYFFPGGHKRENESVKACLIREMKEETGLDIQTSKIKKLTGLQQEGFAKEIFYLIDIGNKRIKYRDDPQAIEHSYLTLIDKQDLPTIPNIYPKAIVEEIIKI